MPPAKQKVPEVKYTPGPTPRPAQWSGYPARKARCFPHSKHRGFVFTNFLTDWDVEEIRQWSNVTFASVGLETCPSTGRMHHQGCVYFKHTRAYSGIDKLLPPNCWFEHAKGNEMQNFTYTSKEKQVLLIGEPVDHQGQRSDLENIRKRIIEEKTTPAELACEEGVSLEDLKFAETVFRLAGSPPKRDWKTSVIWLFGPPGRGKSHIAKALIDANDDAEAWKSSAKLDYWQQYQGHETVWFDEFRGDKCTFTALLEIMDNTPYEVNIKYGSAQLLAKRLIVTSPMHPSKIYPSCAENINQLLRRIDVLWNIDDLYAAAEDGFAFPDVPEFPKFGSVVRDCAASRKIAAPPIRYEGRKCLALIDNSWVEHSPPTLPQVAPGAPACMNQPEPNVCSAANAHGNPPGANTPSHVLCSIPGAEVGGNIAPPTAPYGASGDGPPTSNDQKCSITHGPDVWCDDCLPSDLELEDYLDDSEEQTEVAPEELPSDCMKGPWDI